MSSKKLTPGASWKSGIVKKKPVLINKKVSSSKTPETPLTVTLEPDGENNSPTITLDQPSVDDTEEIKEEPVVQESIKEETKEETLKTPTKARVRVSMKTSTPASVEEKKEIEIPQQIVDSSPKETKEKTPEPTKPEPEPESPMEAEEKIETPPPIPSTAPPPIPIGNSPSIGQNSPVPSGNSPSVSQSSPSLQVTSEDTMEIKKSEEKPLKKKVSVRLTLSTTDASLKKRVNTGGLLSPSLSSPKEILSPKLENSPSPRNNFPRKNSVKEAIKISIDSLPSLKNGFVTFEENQIPCVAEELISYARNGGKFQRNEIHYNFGVNHKTPVTFYEEEEEDLTIDELLKLRDQTKKSKGKVKKQKGNMDDLQYSKDDVIYLNPLYNPYEKSTTEVKQETSLQTISGVLKSFEDHVVKRNNEIEDISSNNEQFLNEIDQSETYSKLSVSEETYSIIDQSIDDYLYYISTRNSQGMIVLDSYESISSSSLKLSSSSLGSSENLHSSGSSSDLKKKSSFFSSFRKSSPAIQQTKKPSILSRLDVPYAIEVEEEEDEVSPRKNQSPKNTLSRKQSVLQKPSGGGLSRKQSVLHKPGVSPLKGQRTGFKTIQSVEEPESDEIPEFKPSESQDPIVKMKEELKYLKSIVHFLDFEDLDDSFLKDREMLLEYDSYDLKNQNAMNEIYVNPVFGEYVSFEDYIVM
jgi:hypothetical protein